MDISQSKQQEIDLMRELLNTLIQEENSITNQEFEKKQALGKKRISIRKRLRTLRNKYSKLIDEIDEDYEKLYFQEQFEALSKRIKMQKQKNLNLLRSQKTQEPSEALQQKKSSLITLDPKNPETA